MLTAATITHATAMRMAFFTKFLYLWGDFKRNATLPLMARHKNKTTKPDTNDGGSEDYNSVKGLLRPGNSPIIPHSSNNIEEFEAFWAKLEIKIKQSCLGKNLERDPTNKKGKSFQENTSRHWIHPRSKFLHQLDHIITNKDKPCTVTDIGVTESMVESDHRALKCKFRIQLKLAKRPPPPPIRNLNLAKLQSQETSTELCEEVMASIIKQQSTITDSPTSTHTKLAEVINTTAPLILGKVGRNQPGWF